MDTALAWFLALLAALSVFDVAAVVFGTDSRDAAPDDHSR